MQLTTITQQLADADQQLADSKARLQRVESQQEWRTLSPRQRKRIIVILTKWKGNGLYFNPVSDDNEVHEFANELDSIFKNAGWQTAWAPLIILATGGGVALTEGLELQFPPEIKQHADVEKGLIEVVKIADRHAKIIYKDQQTAGIHLIIGRKRGNITHPN